MKSVNWLLERPLLFWEDYPWAVGLLGIALIVPVVILVRPLLSGEAAYEEQQVLTVQEKLDVAIAVPRSVIPGKTYVIHLLVKPGPQMQASLPVTSTICLSSPLLRNPEGDDCVISSQEVGNFSKPLSQELSFEALGITDNTVDLSLTLEFPGNLLTREISLRVNRLSMVLRLVISGITGIPGLTSVVGALWQLLRRNWSG